MFAGGIFVAVAGLLIFAIAKGVIRRSKEEKSAAQVPVKTSSTDFIVSMGLTVGTIIVSFFLVAQTGSSAIFYVPTAEIIGASLVGYNFGRKGRRSITSGIATGLALGLVIGSLTCFAVVEANL